MIWRLHQEDFCQALGVASENKHASEGGPTFAPCFDLAAGNADAHGKNYSLLYRPDGIGFAPLYDLPWRALKAWPTKSPSPGSTAPSFGGSSN